MNRVEEPQQTAADTAVDTDAGTEPRPATANTGESVQPSGVFTMILLRSLEERLSVDQLQDLLQRAGETCTVAEFKETAASTSIEQFTRLRREADLVLGLGPNRRR